jgi:hypothetical protein
MGGHVLIVYFGFPSETTFGRPDDSSVENVGNAVQDSETPD